MTSVVRGQVVAEIDPIPYRDRVHIARAQLDSALAELDRQRADLVRTRKEVPIQIEISRRTAAAAQADRSRAAKSLELTSDDVEKGIDEARAGTEGRRTPIWCLPARITRGSQPWRAAARRRGKSSTR